MPRIELFNPCNANADWWDCLSFKEPLIELFTPRDMVRDRLVGVRVINSTHVELYTSPIAIRRNHNIHTEIKTVLLSESKCGPDFSFCEMNINKAIYNKISAKFPRCKVPSVITAMLIDDNEKLVVIHDGRVPWFTTFEKSEMHA